MATAGRLDACKNHSQQVPTVPAHSLLLRLPFLKTERDCKCICDPH